MQKDLEDMTPLHLTTRHKSPKCLALLLKHMAPGEVDTQDRNKVKVLLILRQHLEQLSKLVIRQAVVCKIYLS